MSDDGRTELERRVLEMAAEFKQFQVDVDGFVYWWPIGSGAFTAAHLRILADEMDQRNAAIQATFPADSLSIDSKESA